MDGNNGKKLRNLLLYIGIPVVVLFIIIFLFSNRTPQGATYKYSDILDFFETGRVTEYSLNLGTGEMVLKLTTATIPPWALLCPAWTCSIGMRGSI